MRQNMNIGVPKEQRTFEHRVGLSPNYVKMLTDQGHKCYIEHDAGLSAGFNDLEYQQAGGKIVYSAHEVFGRADFLIKVARPLLQEIEWLRPGTTVAGLLHLGSSRHDKIEKLLENQITAIAFEQIELPDGTGPIRRPLSAIGGVLAAQTGARLLQTSDGGKGILIGGMPGVPAAEVAIIGAGVAGTSAVRAFSGMNAHVTVMDTDLNALQMIYDRFPGIVTMISNPVNIARVCTYADILAGSILVPGERPPIVVTREMVKTMKKRSVLMDISIDEGGCFETSRPTTHELPTFTEEGVIHYCVPNMPSVVARTATHAYLNAAFPYILEIANKGTEKAIQENAAIEHGVCTQNGEVRRIANFAPMAQME
jgi:alanine dehydrogenase